jgi:hypothetical protein
MTLDFTLDKYSKLCTTIQNLHCPIMTVSQFLQSGQPQECVVIVRHDIDRGLSSALNMAELEASFGIRSTYYVRMTRQVYKPDVLAKVQALGHELGYHYEVLTRTRGDLGEAVLTLKKELDLLRQVGTVETASMHGSPLSPIDNRDLWQRCDMREYGLLGEAYLSIDYSGVYYFTDTGRSWDRDRFNLRDRVASRPTAAKVHTTDDLCVWLDKRPDGPLLLNVHPNRWSASKWAWSSSLVSDWIVNFAKLLIGVQRSWLARA